jgi:hypothetical protein
MFPGDHWPETIHLMFGLLFPIPLYAACALHLAQRDECRLHHGDARPIPA